MQNATECPYRRAAADGIVVLHCCDIAGVFFVVSRHCYMVRLLGYSERSPNHYISVAHTVDYDAINTEVMGLIPRKGMKLQKYINTLNAM